MAENMDIMNLRSELARIESDFSLADADMVNMNFPQEVRYQARKRRKRLFIAMCQVNMEINGVFLHLHDPPYDPVKECERNGHMRSRDGFCARCGVDNKLIKTDKEKEKERVEALMNLPEGALK